MAEQTQEPEAEGASEAGVGPISAAAAMAIGARRQRAGVKSDPKLDDFLDRQSRLTELQTEHLHEQRELMLSRLRLGRWKDRVTLALQLLTVMVGLAFAGAVGVMAWQAHEDHGVAIDAFSVPPDFAARDGLTGQVAASEILDRIADFQAKTVTQRPASSYANDWGGDIKVEIPETGVSIGEMNRYLRQWLGSETRISGEILRTDQGLAVTARAGDAPGRRFDGPEADVDRLISEAAEAVYAQTQPYRYAVWLQSNGRIVEAEAEYTRLAESGAPEDRPWALAGWASLLAGQGDYRAAAERAEEAIRIAPGLAAAYRVAELAEAKLSHLQATATIPLQAIRHLDGPDKAFFEAPLNENLGDYRAAALAHGGGTLSSEGRATFLVSRALQADDFARAHEVSRARELISRIGAADGQTATGFSPSDLEAQCRFELEDWRGIAGRSQTRSGMPWLFPVAYARTGRLQIAQALAGASPLDCDECVITRGIVAAAAHDRAGADRWFGLVTRRAPSSPFGPAAWGQALLSEGDLDAAIARLAEAHRRGPRFADPLELWGEALLARRDYGGAVGRFAEADKDAPRWGRNHLLWGEALMLQGRYAEARTQYEAADGMDLSKPDRAALNVLLARIATGPLHG